MGKRAKIRTEIKDSTRYNKMLSELKELDKELSNRAVVTDRDNLKREIEEYKRTSPC